MKINQKKYFIIAFGIILLLIIAFWLLGKNKQKQTGNIEPTPTEMVIPTVDSSVMVDLKPIKTGEVKLTIKNAPQGTEKIEFELSYLAKNNESEGGDSTIPQGSIGECFEIKGEWQCGEPSTDGRKIILGTCSSGVCRYHQLTGPIKVSLRFSGSYGERIFEKEYKI